MPILLYTYLATEMLAPFFASLMILTTILFLGKLVPFLEIIFKYGIDFADFVRLCSYIAPNLLFFSVPMAGMLAVIIAFTKLSNENEIMAFKAAGIGVYKMLPPVIIFALFTTVIAGLSSTYLVPSANLAMRKMLFQLAKEKIDKGLKEKQFSEGINNVVLYVDKIDKKNRSWQGVYVADLRRREAPMTIIADSGSLEARLDEMFLTLTLRNGTMHRSVDDLTQTIQFKTYTLNLPIENPRAVNGIPASQLGKSELTMKGLIQRADMAGRQTPEGRSMIIEFHKRLALPAGCFILCLLGVPLALQSRPGQRSHGLPIGLGFFVLYYLMITAAKDLEEGLTLPAGVFMWLPDLVLAFITFYLIRKSALEKPGKINPLLVALRQKVSLFWQHLRRNDR